MISIGGRYIIYKFSDKFPARLSAAERRDRLREDVLGHEGQK